MKLPNLKIATAARRNNWLLITLFLLGGVFIYYFTAILHRNETRIKERSFRGLSLIAETIQNDINFTLEKNSKNFLQDFNDRKSSKDSINIINSYKLRLDTSNKVLKDSIYNFFISKKGISWNLNFVVKDNNNSKQIVFTDAEEYLKPILRDDLFSRYLIMADNQIIYENIAGSFDTNIKDSLKSVNALHNGLLLTINAEGESYKTFALPFTVQGKEWWLAGLQPSNQYVKEKMQLSGNVIASLIFLFFLCFLFFPFLKCFFMNREEHLNSRDVVFAFFSFYLIAATLITALWNLYTYQGLFRNGRDHQLKEMSGQISTSFSKEISIAIKQLKKADEHIKKDSGFRELMAKSLVQVKDENSVPDILKNLDTVISYPFAENLVWINADGNQRFKWSKKDFISSNINVAQRNYFQKAINNDMWTDSSGNSFYLEAVKSWVEDSKLAVLSMLSDSVNNEKNPGQSDNPLSELKVIVLSGRFQSVFEPVLPNGFGFAVINNSGKVYFHSNTEYDLYEDFIKETGNPQMLTSALNSRMAEYFTTYYYGNNYRFYVKPVKDMPLFIVTFSDVSRLGANNTAMISGLSVFIFIQALLIFLTAILIQAYRAHYSRSGIKTYNLNWLTPKYEHDEAYKQHIWLYIFMALSLIFFSKPVSLWFTKNPNSTLFTPGIILTYSILAVLFSYFLIRVKTNKDEEGRKYTRWFPLSGAIVLYLFILSLFFINLSRQSISLAINFLLAQVVVLLLIYFIKSISQTGYRVVNLVFGIIQNFLNAVFEKNFSFSKKKYSYKNSYILALFLFVVLTSVIPASKMYRMGYTQETTLMLKSGQLNLANSFWQKNDTQKIDNDSLVGKYYKNIIADTVINSGKPIDTFNYPLAQSRGFGWLYRKMRPSYKDYARSLETFTSNQSNDSAFLWMQENDSLILLATNNKSAIINNNLNNLKISSTLIPLQMPGGNNFPGMKKSERFSSFAVLFYTIFILFLFGLYLLIREFLSRVLFPPIQESKTSQEETLEKMLLNVKHQHLMVVGLPDSGKSKAIQDILDKHQKKPKELKPEYKILEMTNPEELMSQIEKFKQSLPDQTKNENPKVKQFILVRNFEYCFHDKEITIKKLKAMEELLRKRHWSIILFSTTQMLPFIEEYFTIIKGGSAYDETAKAEATLAAERWMNVMNNFPIFYYRWQNPEKESDSEYSNSYIDSETKNSDFLYNLKPQVQYEYDLDFESKFNIDYLEEDEKRKEMETEMEMKISQIAAFYFDSVWMSLNLHERKVLYDFAKDGLVNQHNTHELSILYQKGLFTFENNELKLINRSLKHYILTRLDKDEIHKLQAEESEKGNWNKVRNVLVAIILLVGVFLFITQQDALNSLIGYLSAFTGGIFALLNIINKIPGGSK